MASLRRAHRLLPSVLLLAVSMAALSCGIDTIEYLSNDAVFMASSEAGFQFYGPADSDLETYYGQFIYYKIYASKDTADAERSYIESKQNANSAVPGAVVQSQLVSASGYGYHKLALRSGASAATEPIPTLAKAMLATGYLASADFPASQDEPVLSITNESNGSEVASYILMRSVSSTSEPNLSFWDVPDSGQADYKAGTVTGATYYVQFFAVAYGLKYDFSDLYGDAVYLGRITLQF